MSFIEKTEKKFGRFAIPGLTWKIAVLQIFFFIYYWISFDETTSGGKTYFTTSTITETINKLNIGNTTIVSDLLFIIGNPPLLPTGLMNYLFFYFAVNLLILFGNSLEELWGTYKYNLYIFTTIIFALLSSQIMKFVQPEMYNAYPLIYHSSIIYTSIFFAFATYFPKFELLLFFVLPTPIRFLAYLSAAGIIVLMFNMNNFDRFFWGFGSCGAYIIFHYHIIINSQKQIARKNNFDKKIGRHDTKPFHKCKTCGKTEHDDAKLEFRTNDEGEEFCLEHLKK